MNHPLQKQLDPGSKINYEFHDIRPYTLKELSHLFGVDIRTFKNWLIPYTNSIGIKRGRYYNVMQVEKILTFIGLPKSIVSLEP